LEPLVEPTPAQDATNRRRGNRKPDLQSHEADFFDSQLFFGGIIILASLVHFQEITFSGNEKKVNGFLNFSPKLSTIT
jgi:hypothetical protein